MLLLALPLQILVLLLLCLPFRCTAANDDDAVAATVAAPSVLVVAFVVCLTLQRRQL